MKAGNPRCHVSSFFSGPFQRYMNKTRIDTNDRQYLECVLCTTKQFLCFCRQHASHDHVHHIFVGDDDEKPTLSHVPVVGIIPHHIHTKRLLKTFKKGCEDLFANRTFLGRYLQSSKSDTYIIDFDHDTIIDYFKN